MLPSWLRRLTPMTMVRPFAQNCGLTRRDVGIVPPASRNDCRATVPQLLPRVAPRPHAEGTSRGPDGRGLPDLAPEQLARLQLFAYLALLIPLFGILHSLTRESPSRTEVRLVPETVPFIVEVPKPVERVVERIVYVPETQPVESTETPAQ